MAVLTEFFIYYVLIDRKRLALRLTIAKDYVLPVGFAILGSIILGTAYGLWTGITAATGVCVLLLFVPGRLRFRGRGFPYLIPSDRDENIFIYDFEVTRQNAVEMSKTAAALLKEKAFSARTRYLVSLYAEELLLLIMDKNASSRKAVKAECTLILEEDGVRLIMRDSGRIFDLTDTDSRLESFRQYVVANIILILEYKAYVTTTGYNRNEFFFPDERE